MVLLDICFTVPGVLGVPYKVTGLPLFIVGLAAYFLYSYGGYIRFSSYGWMVFLLALFLPLSFVAVRRLWIMFRNVELDV